MASSRVSQHAACLQRTGSSFCSFSHLALACCWTDCTCLAVGRTGQAGEIEGIGLGKLHRAALSQNCIVGYACHVRCVWEVVPSQIFKCKPLRSSLSKRQQRRRRFETLYWHKVHISAVLWAERIRRRRDQKDEQIFLNTRFLWKKKQRACRRSLQVFWHGRFIVLRHYYIFFFLSL